MKRKLMDFKVRHIAKGGAAYATNMDNGEEVFINALLATNEGIEAGDYIRAMVVPNEKTDEVKWYAHVLEIIHYD